MHTANDFASATIATPPRAVLLLPGTPAPADALTSECDLDGSHMEAIGAAFATITVALDDCTGKASVRVDHAETLDGDEMSPASIEAWAASRHDLAGDLLDLFLAIREPVGPLPKSPKETTTMTTPSPVLAFVCGKCRHALDMTCPACTAAEDEFRGIEAQHEVEHNARERAAIRAIPGVETLEETLSEDVELSFDSYQDDGDDMWRASVRLPWGKVTGVGVDEAGAVRNLRARVVADLRDAAQAIEDEEVGT